MNRVNFTSPSSILSWFLEKAQKLVWIMQNSHDWAGAKMNYAKFVWFMLLLDTLLALKNAREWCELCGICVIILDPKRITQNSRDSWYPRSTAWSRESSSFGVDCTNSVSLVDVVSEWHKICSVHKQFPLFVYKRLTKTTVELKMNRHSSVMIIAVWITHCTYHMSNLT